MFPLPAHVVMSHQYIGIITNNNNIYKRQQSLAKFDICLTIYSAWISHTIGQINTILDNPI